MTFEQTRELIEKNQHLIGQNYKGATIDEIVAYPIAIGAQEKFIDLYLQSYNGETALIPFRAMDLEVFCVVDKGRIRAQGIFMHGSLEEISKELDVVFLENEEE